MARVVGVLELAKRCRGALPERDADNFDAALEFPQSLLPFMRFGDARGQYYRGAVVGNVISAVLICAGVVLIGAALVASKLVKPKSERLREDGRHARSAFRMALRACRMPGAVAVACALAIDGLATGASVLAAQSESVAADAALIGLGCACCVGLLVFVVYHIRALTVASLTLPTTAPEHADGIHEVANTAHDAHPLPPPLTFYPIRLTKLRTGEATFRTPNTAGERVLRWLLIGRSTWLPTPEREMAAKEAKARGVFGAEELREQLLNLPTRSGAHHPSANLGDSFVDALQQERQQSQAYLSQAAFEEFGVVVTRYRAATPGDGAFEKATGAMSRWFLVVDLVLTVAVSATQGLATLQCRSAVAAALAFNLVGAILALLLRPYSVPAKNVLLIGMNGLMLAASGATMSAVDASSDDDSQEWAVLASRAAAAAAMIGFLSITLSIARFVVLRVVLSSTLTVDSGQADRDERRERQRKPSAGGSHNGSDEVPLTPLIDLDHPASDHEDDFVSEHSDHHADHAPVMMEAKPSDAAASASAELLLASLLDGPPPTTSAAAEDGDEEQAEATQRRRAALEEERRMTEEEAAAEAAEASRRVYYDAGPRRAVYRTQEGQRRYADLEAMLRGPATSSATGASQPRNARNQAGQAPSSFLDDLLM